ncbi:hypothetical protein [Dictyobacter formicarum]|uniref:hypothetical protein n=1 Tax=Dictyobacter formicarum TaxID=2778368 RepID=UPI0019154679|nr:hypothetical protein [Dictyobacter formicarum]
MMSTWDQAQPAIGHLSVRDRGVEHAEMNAITLRLRTERLLKSADLRPAGLPTSAVLIVRRLDDLAPLSAQSQLLPSDWTTRLHDQIRALYATAARPTLGPVSASATSILFTDPAEMLACLIRDLLSGQAWEYWYWQQVLHGAPRVLGPALTTVWQAQAAFLPAALSSMKQADVYAAVATLSSAQASTVTQALHAAFALPSMVTATADDSPQLTTLPIQPFPSAVSWTPEPHRIPLPEPPWQRWLSPMPPAELAPQAHYLLGLARTLQYAPAFARSTHFMTQVASWLYTNLAATQQKRHLERSVYREREHSSEMPHISSEEVATSSRQCMENHQTASSCESAQRREMMSLLESIPDGNIEAISTSSSITTSASTQNLLPPPVSSHIQTGDTSPISAPPAQISDSPSSSIADNLSGARTTFTNSLDSQPAEKFDEGLPTRLGGILYLVHILSWLDLPVCWDANGDLAEHVGGWGIVEVLARGLLHALHDDWIDDPIWSMLASLDRREAGIPAGATLPPQDAFRLPAQWLRNYGPSAPTWIAYTNQARLLLLEESTGYLVADIPLAGCSLDEVVTAEIEAYQAAGVNNITWHVSNESNTQTLFGNEQRLSGMLSQSTSWWLQRVLSFIQYLLLHTLRQNTHDISLLPDLLLFKSARLLVSRTHIDLYMNMDQISLPIRRVGLDRNPGWVPDLARIILFHFD